MSLTIPLPPRLTIIGSFLILGCFVLQGCTSSRVLKKPLPPRQPDAGWSAAPPEGLSVEVHELIFRNTAGSRLKNANWDEYVLVIKNGSQETFEIQNVDLYSDKIPAPLHSSTSREQLDAKSNTTVRALKDVGIISGARIVAPSALVIAGIGTSGGILSASTAGAAAAAIGVVAIPVSLIGGTVYVVNRRRPDKADKILIERTIKEHALAPPREVPPGAQLEKSVFSQSRRLRAGCLSPKCRQIIGSRFPSTCLGSLNYI